MPKIALSETRVKALRPRPTTYDLRDAKLRGFGVRVLPSGAKRFFIHIQHRGTRVWRIIGDANAITVDGGAGADRFTSRRYPGRRRRLARYDALRGHRRDRVPALCAGLEAANAVRKPELPAPTDSAPVLGDANCRHHPSGRAALVRLASGHPRCRRPLHAHPLRHHDRGRAHGLPPRGLQSLPGMRRYRRKGRERYLSDAEIARLAATLSVHEGERPLQVAAVRLLLLTGSRKSEVLTLRWSDYREGRLFLRDGKTGPRTVWLPRCAQRPRRYRVHLCMGLSGTTRQWAGRPDVDSSFLAAGPCRSGPARRAPP